MTDRDAPPPARFTPAEVFNHYKIMLDHAVLLTRQYQHDLAFAMAERRTLGTALAEAEGCDGEDVESLRSAYRDADTNAHTIEALLAQTREDADRCRSSLENMLPQEPFISSAPDSVEPDRELAALKLAAVLLPRKTRADWLEEQRGYLADLPTLSDRRRWVASQLRGMPVFAFIVRTGFRFRKESA